MKRVPPKLALAATHKRSFIREGHRGLQMLMYNWVLKGGRCSLPEYSARLKRKKRRGTWPSLRKDDHKITTNQIVTEINGRTCQLHIACIFKYLVFLIIEKPLPLKDKQGKNMKESSSHQLLKQEIYLIPKICTHLYLHFQWKQMENKTGLNNIPYSLI